MDQSLIFFFKVSSIKIVLSSPLELTRVSVISFITEQN